MWIHPSDDPYLPIHYPTTNLLPFLQGDERWVSISVCQTAAPTDFLLVGALLADAIAQVDRRVVLLASGGMSHRFWPLQELRQHEASDPVHIITAEARDADQAILARWAEGDHAAVIDGMDAYRAHAPEGRFGHYLMMVGALGGRSCHAAGVATPTTRAVQGPARSTSGSRSPRQGGRKEARGEGAGDRQPGRCGPRRAR